MGLKVQGGRQSLTESASNRVRDCPGHHQGNEHRLMTEHKAGVSSGGQRSEPAPPDILLGNCLTLNQKPSCGHQPNPASSLPRRWLLCRLHKAPVGCTLGTQSYAGDTGEVAGISRSRRLTLSHKCEEEKATLNFLSFSKYIYKKKNITTVGGREREMRISVLSSAEHKELNSGPGGKMLPNSPGEGEGTLALPRTTAQPGDGGTAEELHPCHHRGRRSQQCLLE